MTTSPRTQSEGRGAVRRVAHRYARVSARASRTESMTTVSWLDTAGKPEPVLARPGRVRIASPVARRPPPRAGDSRRRGIRHLALRLSERKHDARDVGGKHVQQPRVERRRAVPFLRVLQRDVLDPHRRRAAAGARGHQGPSGSDVVHVDRPPARIHPGRGLSAALERTDRRHRRGAEGRKSGAASAAHDVPELGREASRPTADGSRTYRIGPDRSRST